MKLNEIPEEYRERVAFACRVCRIGYKTETCKTSNCAWRQIGGEVCFDIERAIEAERASGYEVCDACGKYPKQPNSMLCKECEDKSR
jgi:hypothetical protein